MKNLGKIFEENWKKSCNDIFCYRLKDSSQNWNRTNVARFTPNNICDFILFDGDIMLLCELKNTKEKSFPLGNIKQHQLRELALNSHYKRIYPCIIINFSELEQCYYMPIDTIVEFIRKNERKSIPISYCEENGIKVDMKRLKTNYRYNISKLLEQIKTKN